MKENIKSLYYWPTVQQSHHLINRFFTQKTSDVEMAYHEDLPSCGRFIVT